MRIPKHWAKGAYPGQDQKGRPRNYWAWGWSCDTISEATAMAAARARKAFENFLNKTPGDTYDYLDLPLREEIVDTIGGDSEPTAVMTRNRYGALVLNSAKVCFVDVDFPKTEPAGLLESLKMLFSAKKRQAQAEAEQQETLQRVRQWASQNPRRSFRLYRTAAGLRMLMTDRLYDPNSAEVATLFEELGSDALYRKLTQKQECFRARLTPKPWRCGCKRPTYQYPWHRPDFERAYRKWQQNYEKKSQGYGTCHFLQAFGAQASDEPIRRVIEFHDRMAGCEPQVKLA